MNMPVGPQHGLPLPSGGGRPIEFDEATLTRFLSYILHPGDCHEVCVIRGAYRTPTTIGPADFNITLASWYDSPQAIIADAAKLKGVSGYIVPNPIDLDLIARSHNKLNKQKHRTTDDDIRAWFWVLLDLDVKRKADTSATDAELVAALDRLASIHATHPEIAAASIWGRSGNGGWNLVRVPGYAFNDESMGLVSRFLAELARRFDTDTIKVDQKTKNPARLMCLPGTMKCKGENSTTTGRVWRLATLDSPIGHTPTPLDLAAWLDEYETPPPPTAPPAPRIAPATTSPVGSERERRIARAGAYLNGIAPAVSGQGGHDQTFDAACALVKGFDLSVAEARPLLAAWNTLCVPPWDAGDLEHKLSDADGRPDDKPRGYLYDRERDRGDNRPIPAAQLAAGAALAAAMAAGATFDIGGEQTTAGTNGAHHGAPGGLNGHHGGNGAAHGGNGTPNGQPNAAAHEDDGPGIAPDDDSHRLARAFLEEKYAGPHGYRLRYYQDEWHVWDAAAGCYRVRSRVEIRAELSLWIHEEFLRLHNNALRRWGAKKGNERGKKPVLRNVTCGVTANVTQALTSLVVLDAAVARQIPSWTGPHPWNPVDILPARNALIHLPSWAAGEPFTLAPTPAYFSTYATGFDFTATPPEPTEWLAFLGQQWGSDRESVDLLQEWMGYLLTTDTSLQKILMLIGPKRSGKGTITRVITALLGEPNVTNPTLSGLAGRFGLASLVGKPAAIVSDARISGRTDTAVVVERLLSISGEDSQTVDRKGKDEITVKLPTRFTIVSNELPRMQDASGALAGRLLLLKMTRSFYGEEDSELFDRLAAELPSILVWAMEGWKRLRARRRFKQPVSGRETLEAMEGLSSPTLSFVSEHVKIESGASVLTTDVYNRWRTWCQAAGDEHPGTETWFGRNLRAAIPTLAKERRRTHSGREHFYLGIRLLYPGEIPDSAEHEEEDSTPETTQGTTSEGGTYVPF